jgi:hypothetical protein
MFRTDIIGPGASHYERPRVAASDLSLDAIPRRLPVLLTAVGMVASTVALWSYVQALPSFVEPGGFDFSLVEKPPSYYAAHGLEILCICCAGLIALTSVQQHLLRRYGLRFLLFLFAGALMAFRGYSWSGALSVQIFSSTGPFICIVSVLMAVGAQPRNWRILDKIFLSIAVAYSAFAVVGMFGVESADRWEVVLRIQLFLNALYWPATWMLLRPGSWRSPVGWLRYGPFAVYAIGSIFTQTRLNWVMILAALVAYAYVQRRRQNPMAPRLILAAALGLWLILFSTEYLSNAKFVQTLQASADAFLSRMDEDTRTGQLSEFFANVQISELLLGRGSLATWNWHGSGGKASDSEWAGGTDIGYLTLLFYGGVPLLLTYVVVHICPAFGAISRPQTEWQRSCAAIVLLWALRMFSSTCPSLTIEYYPVLLCMGCCLGQAQRLSIGRASNRPRGIA